MPSSSSSSDTISSHFAISPRIALRSYHLSVILSGTIFFQHTAGTGALVPYHPSTIFTSVLSAAMCVCVRVSRISLGCHVKRQDSFHRIIIRCVAAKKYEKLLSFPVVTQLAGFFSKINTLSSIQVSF